MSVHSKSIRSLSNQLTDDYLNGRWSQLLSYPSMGGGWTQAFQARAHLMQGQVGKAIEILNQNQNNNDPWLRGNELICRSHIEFTSQHFQEALALANQAQKQGPQELAADATFYRALALCELGDKYQALTLYSQIRKNSNVTDYRKNLALTNEAWLLWDLGIIEPLARIAGDLLPPYGFRIRLLLSMMNGDSDILNKLNATAYIDLPLHEKENIFINLVELCLVYGQETDLEVFRESLFFQEIKHDSENPLVHAIVSLLARESEVFTFEGRDQIDWLFVQSLYWAKRENQKAQEIYFQKLIPLMKQLEFYSLLIVNFETQKAFFYQWQNKLAQLVCPTRKITESLILIDTEKKTLIFNQQRLSFVTSPTTWKLLMAFEKEVALTKESIHAILTMNRYRSDLHDMRIFKLVQRLNQKAREIFGFEICRFDGENRVELICQLKRSGT